MPFTIYDLPDSASADYARRQEQYDQDIAAGRITPAGVAEATAYQAARVRAIHPQPSELETMMGLNVQTQIALFVPMPGVSSAGGFSTMGTPALGSVSQRETDKERIQELVLQMPPKDMRDNEVAALAIVAVIDRTIRYDAEASFILGQMGSLTAG